MKTNLKWLSLILLVIAQISVAAPKQEQVLDSVVVVVNSEVITESQVQFEMQDMQATWQARQLQNPDLDIPSLSPNDLRTEALQNLVDRSLQRQFAKKAKIEITSKQIDETISAIAQQNNLDMTGFEKVLEEQGMTISQYRKKIHQQLLDREIKQRAVAPKVKISDQEIQAGLNNPENPLNFRHRYLLQDYLVEVSENADEKSLKMAKAAAARIASQLKAGKQPNTTDAEFLDFGWRRMHEFPDVFAENVKDMKKGEVRGPIMTANGYHVIKLADKQSPYENHQTHEYQVRHILMKPTALLTDNLVKKQLNKIRNEVAQGTAFSKLARKYSEDYTTAPKGGDMGWMSVRQMPPKFAQAVSDLRKGDVSQPFQSEAGWHLLFIENVRSKDDSQAMLEQETKSWIFQQKIQDEYETFIKKLRENTFVQYTNASDKPTQH